VKYAAVEELANKSGVRNACELLSVSTSGYYEWRRRGPSQRDIDDAKLLEQIREEHMLSRGRFGVRKVWHRLKERGMACGLRRVTRLMRQEGLKSRCFRVRRSITVADESAAPVPNVLNREFVAEKPNEKWVSDITQCRTRAGWIYLAVVLDLCSRRVVRWSVSPSPST
jgi:putative transposase